jgi:hypothetical protein
LGVRPALRTGRIDGHLMPGSEAEAGAVHALLEYVVAEHSRDGRGNPEPAA